MEKISMDSQTNQLYFRLKLIFTTNSIIVIQSFDGHNSTIV